MENDSIIKLVNVKKAYADTLAVVDSTFSVNKGEIVALLGSNGAGKSTTIKMLCGLLKPTSGSLTLNGMSYETNAEDIRQKIGYMPEESAMYLDVTAEDYLLFFGRLYGNSDEKTRKIIHRFFHKLDFHAGDKKLSELSKGMRRKVLLVRSLLNNPAVLIYDEPASGLDPQTAHVILDFLRSLASKGHTILFSSHNLEHVRQISDRLLIMRKGSIIADTTVEEFEERSEKQFRIETTKGEHVVGLDGLKAFVLDNSKDIVSVSVQSKSFEEVYLDFIQK